MTKLNSSLTVVLTTLALCLVTACTSTRTQKSAGEGIDDAVIGTKIKAALIGDPVTEAHHIDVQVFKGRVQLNGFVESAAEITQAAKLARDVGGVVAVDNHLKVRAEKTAGTVMDDTALMGKVKAALIGDSRTKSHQIELAINQGVVQMAGFVDNAATRTAAVGIVRAVDGVVRIDDHMAIK
jgi:hyperosmotically inducible periplasmic protein